MTTAIEAGEWSAARPGRTLLPRKTRYPLYRRLGGPQGRSGRAENLTPPGFDPRTVQPVVSHYTDWATRLRKRVHSEKTWERVWLLCTVLHKNIVKLIIKNVCVRSLWINKSDNSAFILWVFFFKRGCITLATNLQILLSAPMMAHC